MYWPYNICYRKVSIGVWVRVFFDKKMFLQKRNYYKNKLQFMLFLTGKWNTACTFLHFFIRFENAY